eukprot:COSAG01_NODE_37758_length_499_cov_0.900000_1_plen_43_part_00
MHRRTGRAPLGFEALGAALPSLGVLRELNLYINHGASKLLLD